MNPDILNALKSFNWCEIISKGNRLEDLNDNQWRFMKGLIVELLVEKYSGPDGLVYIGQHHKDYDWPKFNVTVELKSGLSSSMFGKNGNLHKHFSVKLNNSNGTNKKENPDINDVADYLIVVKNNGAFVLDRETVIKNTQKTGDGFDLKVNSQDIIPITDKITVNKQDNFNIKESIINAIRAII